jgi:hypothetical protein
LPIGRVTIGCRSDFSSTLDLHGVTRSTGGGG